MDDLKKNWIWIVIPILIVSIIAVVIYQSNGGADPEFIYPV